MNNITVTTASTVTCSSGSSTSKRSNTTVETTTTTTHPPILLANPTLTPPPSSSSSSLVTDADYITAVGLCGVNGYEAEVNHTIGLCHEARTDHHLLLTVGKCRTHSYIVRKKNRLMYACLTANLRWFRTLFRMTGKNDIVDVRTTQNETLYHLVCTLPERWNTRKNKVPERIQILNTLLTTNIDFNVKCLETNTWGVVQPTAMDIVTMKVLLWTIREEPQKFQVIRWWLDHYDRFDAANRNRCLPWLAYDNRLVEVRRLCQAGNTNLNISTGYNATALIMASFNGHVAIVDELLIYYPHRLTNLNHHDASDSTALHWACRKNHLDIVQRLCRHPDVDFNLADDNGDTPSIVAAYEGHALIVNELLTYYPLRLTNLNHQNNGGYTALHWACCNNNLDIVQRLCRHPDVDLNLADQFGNTPLFMAALNGHLAIVDELLTYYPHRLASTDRTCH